MTTRTTSASSGGLPAWSGLLFVALFVASLILGGVLAASPLPMPDAPAAETARYYEGSGTAVLVGGLLQALSAVSLLVFAPHVAAFARRAPGGEGATLSRLVLVGGVSAAGLLMLSAVFSGMLALWAAGGNLALVGALRDLNFLAGGAAHVAFLGLFVCSGSVAASRARAFPRWVVGVGFLAAALSVLSLASLAWFPATFLIPLGRLLSFVWIVAAGLLLALGEQREPGDQPS